MPVLPLPVVARLRSALAVLLAIAPVALAGCAQGDGADLGEDGNGGSTGAGLGGEASAGTVTVGPSPPIDPQPRPGAVPQGLAVEVGKPGQSAMSEEVHLELAARVDGGLAEVTAVAHQTGNRTLYYSAGQCGVPWNDELVGPPGLVQRRTAGTACGDVQYDEWTPGTAIAATWLWNGTHAIQGEDGQFRLQPAPAGDYTWTISVAASSCASSECNLATLSVSVPVKVRSA